MIVAAPDIIFGLPESTVEVYARAGGLARVARNCGLQIGTEIALTGRRLTAPEAQKFILINRISNSRENVVDKAVELAKHIASLSPDATFVTRQGLREVWETGSVERATQITAECWGEKVLNGENLKIGLAASAAKKPLWIASNL